MFICQSFQEHSLKSYFSVSIEVLYQAEFFTVLYLKGKEEIYKLSAQPQPAFSL